MNPGDYCTENNGVFIEYSRGMTTYLQRGRVKVTVEQAEALKAYRWEIVSDIEDGKVIVERK